MGFRSVLFVVTPDELEELLGPFTLFIGNARVERNYISTPSADLVDMYSALFKKLCSGEMIDPKKDYMLLKYYYITADISSVKWKNIDADDNKTLYKRFDGTSRGYAPYFAPFAFSAYTENDRLYVSTRSSWAVTYAAQIMGYQLLFPEFSASDKEYYGIGSEKEWQSYADFTLFSDTVRKMTSPLKMSLKGIEKKTQIRVSEKALQKLPCFYCIASRGIKIC